MLTLRFGSPTNEATETDGERALHLQCLWRLDAADRVVTFGHYDFEHFHEETLGPKLLPMSPE